MAEQRPDGQQQQHQQPPPPPPVASSHDGTQAQVHGPTVVASPSSIPSASEQGQTPPHPQFTPNIVSNVPQNALQANPSNVGQPPFNMASMAATLPQSQPQPIPQAGQRGLSGASPSAIVYQFQQNMQIPGQPVPAYPAQTQMPHGFAQPSYIPQYPAMPQTGYPMMASQHRSAGPSPVHQTYPTFPQHAQPYYYYPAPYGINPQPQMFPPVVGQPIPPGRRSSFPASQNALGYPGADMSMLGSSLPLAAGRPVGFGGGLGDARGSSSSQASIAGTGRTGSESGFASLPRGPPRKPRQSGHALWVGNLPPGTTVTDLKDHFSRDATKDIESLFLISKSNCAFVNYRTEESCTAAMHRFHDSRFHGVRLVCRLRRSSTPASGVPTGPSAMSAPRESPTSSSKPNTPSPSPGEENLTPQDEEKEEALESVDGTRETETEGTTPPTGKVSEKFFIVKSLTVQDLELSVRNGIWATQSHNEEALNKAYETADKVFLIFSANKSGEYFGYARMTSPISQDAAEIMSTIPRPGITEPADAPKSIPTPATQYAPKGRIIDDSARGTIFWEAELSDSDEEPPKSEGEEPEMESATGAQAWGKPFKVEWYSSNRLPFYRTRGLRNPWNANREVKIARDGTELETNVGKRLVQMFHRMGPSNAPHPSVIPQVAMAIPPNMQQQMGGGPPMRPF